MYGGYYNSATKHSIMSEPTSKVTINFAKIVQKMRHAIERGDLLSEQAKRNPCPGIEEHVAKYTPGFRHLHERLQILRRGVRFQPERVEAINDLIDGVYNNLVGVFDENDNVIIPSCFPHPMFGLNMLPFDYDMEKITALLEPLFVALQKVIDDAAAEVAEAAAMRAAALAKQAAAAAAAAPAP
jgi:hypothetical protein